LRDRLCRQDRGFSELRQKYGNADCAANPQYVRREEVSQAVLDKEKEIYRAQALESKKPEKVIDKIVEGN